MVYRLAVVVFGLYAHLFHRLKVTGTEHVPRTGGVVVASNHISSLDPPMIGVSLPRQVHFMAKRELFEKTFSRWLVTNLKAYPVDRTKSDTGAIKASLRKLADGLAVGIFPQGTRNTGDASAFGGAAFLAQRSGVPLLPTSLWRESGRFRVHFGAPIIPQGKTREEMAALTEALMVDINAPLPKKIAEPLAESPQS